MYVCIYIYRILRNIEQAFYALQLMMLSFFVASQVKFLFYTTMNSGRVPWALMSRFTLSPKGEFRIECNQQEAARCSGFHAALLAPSKEVCSEEP